MDALAVFVPWEINTKMRAPTHVQDANQTANVIFILKSASKIVQIKFQEIKYVCGCGGMEKESAAAATRKKISSLDLMTFSLPNCKTHLAIGNSLFILVDVWFTTTKRDKSLYYSLIHSQTRSIFRSKTQDPHHNKMVAELKWKLFQIKLTEAGARLMNQWMHSFSLGHF